MLEPFLRNFADNPIMVQFVHRWLAFAVAAVAFGVAGSAWSRGERIGGALLAGLVTVQILLGVATLITGVELWVAAAHQGTAALLLGAAVLVCHRLGEREAIARPAAANATA